MRRTRRSLFIARKPTCSSQRFPLHCEIYSNDNIQNRKLMNIDCSSDIALVVSVNERTTDICLCVVINT